MHFGSQPLREFYQEPFRWDQRIFIQAVGAGEGVSSSQYLHPQLRTFCEVTGGAHWVIRSNLSIPSATDALLKRLCPPIPRELPLPDPLFKTFGAPPGSTSLTPYVCEKVTHFVNGGPICCFQSFEGDKHSNAPSLLRAMLLYVGSTATVSSSPSHPETIILNPPMFCIPEAFFPSKKLDTLPPRPAQPKLFYTKHPANLGSKSFDPNHIIKLLHRLDQLTTSNQKASSQSRPKLLHRDVYVCEWQDSEGGKPVQVSIGSRSEYFPVFVPGAGRPTLSDTGDNYLNIGVLCVPAASATMATQASPNRLATLTLLPPEPHILLPLLLKAAEAEHRAIKKLETAKPAVGGAILGLIQKQSTAKLVVPIDENWKSDFRAYIFRLPPYYHDALKRCLRPLLPSSVQSLLHADGMEIVAMQCFSKICHQKIRNGEQIAKDNNERLDRQEAILRWSNSPIESKRDEALSNIGYGQYDPRTSTDSYLAALRNMPPPWRASGAMKRPHSHSCSDTNEIKAAPNRSAVDVLGDLPAKCMMAYYESRRRWIFGGPGLTIRGLQVDGTRNDGSNSQPYCGKFGEREECPLSLAGVGVSCLNQTTNMKMGEYRERLLFSRSPVVGYGSNDSAGVSATTAIGTSSATRRSLRAFSDVAQRQI